MLTNDLLSQRINYNIHTLLKQIKSFCVFFLFLKIFKMYSNITQQAACRLFVTLFMTVEWYFIMF